MMSAISSLNSVNVNFQPLKKQETDKTVKQDNKSIQTSINDQGASRAYVLGGVSFGGKGKKTDDIKQWINALPFAENGVK